MKYVIFDDFFSVLGNPQRVRILQYLNRHNSKSVTEICKALDMEQSSVSHNLKRLSQCHFVERRTLGKQRIYTINQDTVRPLFELINRHVSKYCVRGCEHWTINKQEVANASR